MILRLVWRSLARRPGRSALLLFGYALGVGVTIALLSIGGALLEQARDRKLVGGGDLTILPAGLDLETFRTGGVSSLYFTIEQAPFLHRQVLEGPRFEGRVRAAAPWIDDELVYVRSGPAGEGPAVAASAGGQIPSRAAALGVRASLVAGSWEDAPADRTWTAPSDSVLYASMDAFHLPPPSAAGDSTWAEWHYFNVLLPGGAGWLYMTFMVAGEVPDGRWGGRILATLVEPRAPPAPGGAPLSPGSERAWVRKVPPDDVTFHTDRPDLRMGPATVRLTREGRYRIRVGLPRRGGREPLEVDLTVRPVGRKYLPPLEIAPGDFASGYTVPVLDGRASGRICVEGACRTLRGAQAYHDHNWGVWRDVTWDWGQATAGKHSLLYGGVRRSGGAEGSRFMFLADSLGFAGLLPVDEIGVRWGGRGPGVEAAPSPDTIPSAAAGPERSPIPAGLEVRAASSTDTACVQVEVRHVRATEPSGPRGALGATRLFYQLHGRALLRARLRGDSVRARGPGFFETWRELSPDVPEGNR